VAAVAELGSLAAMLRLRLSILIASLLAALVGYQVCVLALNLAHAPYSASRWP